MPMRALDDMYWKAFRKIHMEGLVMASRRADPSSRSAPVAGLIRYGVNFQQVRNLFGFNQNA